MLVTLKVLMLVKTIFLVKEREIGKEKLKDLFEKNKKTKNLRKCKLKNKEECIMWFKSFLVKRF